MSDLQPIAARLGDDLWFVGRHPAPHEVEVWDIVDIGDCRCVVTGLDIHLDSDGWPIWWFTLAALVDGVMYAPGTEPSVLLREGSPGSGRYA